MPSPLPTSRGRGSNNIPAAFSCHSGDQSSCWWLRRKPVLYNAGNGEVYGTVEASRREGTGAKRGLRQRVIAALERLENDLAGDVKHLTGFTPEYRLRVGDYRVLFEIEGDSVIVYRVCPRKEAYRK